MRTPGKLRRGSGGTMAGWSAQTTLVDEEHAEPAAEENSKIQEQLVTILTQQTEILRYLTLKHETSDYGSKDSTGALSP